MKMNSNYWILTNGMKMQNEITFYIGKSNKSLFWKKVDSRNRTSRPMSWNYKMFFYISDQEDKESRTEKLLIKVL